MAKQPGSRELKESLGRQCAALPLALRDGEMQVMLVTSRGTGRWVLPKGWEEPGSAPHDQAAREAFEEAGLVGTIEAEAIGFYTYEKGLSGGRAVRCTVSVYPFWVDRQLEDWPEREQRETRWFTPAEAATAVEEGELTALLLHMAASRT